jgi:Fe-S cluster assembly protein SufD
MDEDALFYLCSRGLMQDDARNLLIEAFVNEIVDKLEDKYVRDIAHKHIQSYLQEGL